MNKSEISDLYKETLDQMKKQTRRFSSEALINFMEDLSFHNDRRLPQIRMSDDGTSLNVVYEDSHEEVLNDENLTECMRILDVVKNEKKKAG